VVHRIGHGNVSIAMEGDAAAGADHPHYRKLVRQIISRVPNRRFKVLGDSGYDSEDAHEWTRSQMGLVSVLALAGKTAWSRKRDMMLKVLVHNLMVLRPRGSRQSSFDPFSGALFGRR